MSELVLEVTTGELAGVRVPGFKLREGELVQLVWLGAQESREVLVSELTRPSNRGLIHLHQPLAAAYPVGSEDQSEFWGHNSQSIRRWISRRLKNEAEVEELLARRRIPGSMRWVNQRGVEKYALGLEVAALQAPNVVFTTAGLDPAGADHLRALSERVCNGGRLELLFAEPDPSDRVESGRIVRCEQPG